ncbi:MAG TPA: cytochrome P460 family protein [Gaiellaceae bacterium]|nr:cytochrome P460 family protein [Gaiellaceae bacterium]
MARFAGLALLVLALAACGGDSEPAAEPEPEPATTSDAATTEPAPEEPTTSEEAAPPPPPAPPAAPTPLPGLPNWTAGYREWMKLNEGPIPPRDADPHLGTKNVYASKEKRRDLYPAGTVIVKEARRPGADFVGLVAGMRKVPGSNPEHNDWIFVEWTRESRDAPFTELARGAVCESCHSGVAPQDYVFTTG